METQVVYKFAPLMADIVAALPGTWKAEPINTDWEDSNFHFIREDGLTLYFSGPNYSHKNAFQVSYSPPSDPVDRTGMTAYENGDRVVNPSIRMSKDKAGEQIAKDITRRLLPEAERVHPLYLAACAARVESANKRDAVLARVIKAAGLTPEEFRGHKQYQVYLKTFGTVEVYEGGSIEFKLYSMDITTAERVIKALQG